MHLSEWPKFKTLITPNADKSNSNPHSLLMGMQNGRVTLENNLAVSYKTKNLYYMTQMRLKLIFTQTCTWMFIVAHNHQNLEATKTSFSRQMHKLWYINIMELNLVLKRNKPSSHDKTWKNLKCILLNERDQYEKAACCIIITTLHYGKGRTVVTVKNISAVATG